MKTILIANRKGGVGKTTTAINLASAFYKQGKRVVIIDLDTQSHIQYGFGYKKSFKKGIHKAMMHGKLDKIIQQTPFGIYLAPADINFDISNIPNKKNRLKNLLKEIKNEFDICIIDTPPTSDILLKNGLVASDFVIVPMQTEYLGLVGAIQFLKMFYKTASTLNTNFKLLGVVPTLYNKSINEHNKILDKLKSTIGENRVLTSIRKDFDLSRAFIVGKPILDFKPRSRGSKDYKILAHEILHKI